MSIKTLILDDDKAWQEILKEIFGHEGHSVECVDDLSEAKKQLHREFFHLAIIDIALENGNLHKGGQTGLELIDEITKLNQNPTKFCGPLVITGNATAENALKALNVGSLNSLLGEERPIVFKRGSDGKGFKKQELLKSANGLLKKVLIERSKGYERKKYTLRFELDIGQKIKAELIGPKNFVKEGRSLLSINIDSFSNRTDDLQAHFDALTNAERKKWRTRAKELGEDLHRELIAADSEVNTCIASAQAHAGKAPLHLVFRGPSDMIRLPFELLPGDIGYLIVDYPLVRQISGVTVERGIDPLYFEESNLIKILLIGSNTLPEIPGVDDEILRLNSGLKKLLHSRGFKFDINMIPTENATFHNVYENLRNCDYHIVHYAGHGYHDEQDSDESGLQFWEKENFSGEIRQMPIRILRNLLKGSETRFFYLSCCQAAKASPEYALKLNGNDFQGIIEGLARIGIPSVMGYRWNVRDKEAKQLALAFYENLFTDLSLDIALFKARRKLEEGRHHNETWASPVLVTQTI